MKFDRLFTTPTSPYPGIKFVTRKVTAYKCKITELVAPEAWSQTAVDVLASKYVRRAGVPLAVRIVEETGVPPELRRRAPLEGCQYGHETDARHVFDRLTGCWAYWGWKVGIFGLGDQKSLEDALAYRDELRYLLAIQAWAPNSPQWFNTGLHWAYGITAPDAGQWCISHEQYDAHPDRIPQHCPAGSGVERSKEPYERPAVNACFILGIKDTLLGPGGIMDTITEEARIFKFGGGAGANWGGLRAEGEALSGGGGSSGPLSFMDVSDAGGGAIKSGGTTRRAAKMDVMPIDHPDVERFIDWKVEEEYRAAAMLAGDRLIRNRERYPEASDLIPSQVWRGSSLVPAEPYTTHFEGHSSVYRRAGGQNANNSVRVPDQFLAAVRDKRDWNLINRSDGTVAKTVDAEALWDRVARAAHACADPGVQFDTTCNDWHTCPADGRQNATNPCSEYSFLDDTACNLASIRVTAFAVTDWKAAQAAGVIIGGDVAAPIAGVNVELLRHTARLVQTTLDVSVSMAGYPSERVATGSWQYRTTGLGFADLGALLMRMGLPYDSPEGRAWAAAIEAIIHLEAIRTSAGMAEAVGPFPRYAANAVHVQRVVGNHCAAARELCGDPVSYVGLSTRPTVPDGSCLPGELLKAIRSLADDTQEVVRRFGMRNAQVTCIAPTGTIGLVMDCDTTGIEPDFALVKDKKLVGGGYMKLVSRSVPAALIKLGYSASEIKRIGAHVFGSREVPEACSKVLEVAGVPAEAREAFALNLRAANTIEDAARYCMTADQWCDLIAPLDEAFRAAWYAAGSGVRPLASLLAALDPCGTEEYRAANAARAVASWNDEACGHGTLEGSEVRAADLAVFDCANRCGDGDRFLTAYAHLAMMAAVQPFVSGAISKTINLPQNASVEDVRGVYTVAHGLMIKAVALYIDNQKMSQPLNSVAGPLSTAGVVVATRPCDAGPADSVDMDNDAFVALPYDGEESDGLIIEGDGYRVAFPSGPPAPPADPKAPTRKRLPSRRGGYTQTFKLGGQRFYLRTGEYPDGTIGEVFIDTASEGAAFRSLANALAIAVSLGLQHGVPLEEFTDAFVGSRFEPHGPVQDHPRLKMGSSFLDVVFRDLAITYQGADELAHTQPEAYDGRPKSAGVSPIVAAGRTADLTEEIDRAAWASFSAGAGHDDRPPQPVADPPRQRSQGMTGNACPDCGNFTLKRTGNCTTCQTCGYNSGCG